VLGADGSEGLRISKDKPIAAVGSGNKEEEEVEDGEDYEGDDDSCIVCWENPKDCVLYKCGHLCMTTLFLVDQNSID
jgi:hypothetical protein